MQAKTLQKLIDEYIDQGGDTYSLGVCLARALNEEKRVKSMLSDWSRDRLKLTKQHMEDNEKLDALMRDIQSSCPHLETTHHCDPAGGSAAYTSCDLCGKEL